MFSVLQRQHERTGGREFLELNVSDPERMLNEFLQTCTVRRGVASWGVRLDACERELLSLTLR